MHPNWFEQLRFFRKICQQIEFGSRSFVNISVVSENVFIVHCAKQEMNRAQRHRPENIYQFICLTLFKFFV